jgi:hypothetical protein
LSTDFRNLLPPGLQFLQFGWWIMHALAIALVYAWGYRKGRRAEKNARLHGAGAARPAARDSKDAPPDRR